MEVKPAEFARMAGVTRQSVYSKMKNHALIVNAAGLLDTDNPLNSRYLSDQRLKHLRLAPAQITQAPTQDVPNSPAPPGPSLPFRTTDAVLAAEAAVPEELLDLPLRELIIRYGGMYGLERQAKIYQQLTAANDRYQRTQERGLKLIPKEFVQGTTIQFLKNVTRQILEYPAAAADNLIAKVQAHGADAKPEIIHILQAGLGRIISGAKEEVIRDLELLKGNAGVMDAEPEAEGTSDG